MHVPRVTRVDITLFVDFFAMHFFCWIIYFDFFCSMVYKIMNLRPFFPRRTLFCYIISLFFCCDHLSPLFNNLFLLFLLLLIEFDTHEDIHLLWSRLQMRDRWSITAANERAKNRRLLVGNAAKFANHGDPCVSSRWDELNGSYRRTINIHGNHETTWDLSFRCARTTTRPWFTAVPSSGYIIISFRLGGYIL